MQMQNAKVEREEGRKEGRKEGERKNGIVPLFDEWMMDDKNKINFTFKGG